MTIEQLVNLVQTAGPATIFALVWWLERQERLRLQRLLEGFLPTVRNLVRSINDTLTGPRDDNV